MQGRTEIRNDVPDMTPDELKQRYIEQRMLPVGEQADDWPLAESRIVERLDEHHSPDGANTVRRAGIPNVRWMDLAEKVRFYRDTLETYQDDPDDLSIRDVNMFNTIQRDLSNQGMIDGPYALTDKATALLDETAADDADTPTASTGKQPFYARSPVGPTLTTGTPREADWADRVDVEQLYDTLVDTLDDTWSVDNPVVGKETSYVQAYAPTGSIDITANPDGTTDISYTPRIAPDGPVDLEGLDAVTYAVDTITDHPAIYREDSALYADSCTPDDLAPVLDAITILDTTLRTYA